MKKTCLVFSVFSAFLLAACSHVEPKPPPVSAAPSPPPEPTRPVAEATASVGDGLSELSAMTFACPKAALNAAARAAKAVKSQGSYQFTYFRMLNNAHHSLYEVHFKSNVYDEPELKYCVSLYCQQGWDPKTAKTEVRLVDESKTGNSKAAKHDALCGHEAVPGKKRK
ncbi:hypothetical protein [Methyloterricola oryzae]|uniref:hypothetical protein n=1 Tax=Methyloterricola oryzae TaxID=1495050 RepID=UPI0011AFC122|nr:hypothetical protein [Methyloterricola oryzae]